MNVEPNESTGSIVQFKKILSFCKKVFVPITLLWLLFVLWQSRQLISDLLSETSILQIAILIGMWILLHFLTPIFTVLALSNENDTISYRKALEIHISYLPAKYLPGGIWHSVARTQDYFKQGFSAKHISLYLIHENIILAATTLLLGSSLVLSLYEGNTSQFVILSGGLIGCCTLVLWPVLINKLGGKTKFIHSLRVYSLSVLLIIAYWLLAGHSFAAYFNLLPDTINTCSASYSAGVYIFSWGVGFITIFAPQGLGITEAVSSEFLCSTLNTSNIIAVVASFRIIILIADLSIWSIFRLIKIKFNNKGIIT